MEKSTADLRYVPAVTPQLRITLDDLFDVESASIVAVAAAVE
jgi:hypothetical protein